MRGAGYGLQEDEEQAAHGHEHTPDHARFLAKREGLLEERRGPGRVLGVDPEQDEVREDEHDRVEQERRGPPEGRGVEALPHEDDAQVREGEREVGHDVEEPPRAEEERAPAVDHAGAAVARVLVLGLPPGDLLVQPGGRRRGRGLLPGVPDEQRRAHADQGEAHGNVQRVHDHRGRSRQAEDLLADAGDEEAGEPVPEEKREGETPEIDGPALGLERVEEDGEGIDVQRVPFWAGSEYLWIWTGNGVDSAK